jgi:hypothetical protein
MAGKKILLVEGMDDKGSRRNNFRDPRASMRCGCEARGAWRSPALYPQKKLDRNNLMS